MVAQVARGDTTQWEVMAWALEQAQYMTPTQHHVLLYLSISSFYRSDNPENGEVGQVMRQSSYVSSISHGTGLKRDAIRQALVGLQVKGYLQREVRQDRGIHGQQPHLMYILWEKEADDHRKGMRDGTKKLPPELLAVPTKPSGPKDRAPVLTLVQDGD